MTSETLGARKSERGRYLSFTNTTTKHITKIGACLEKGLYDSQGTCSRLSWRICNLVKWQAGISEHSSHSDILRAAIHLPWHRTLYMQYWPAKSKEGWDNGMSLLQPLQYGTTWLADTKPRERWSISCCLLLLGPSTRREVCKEVLHHHFSLLLASSRLVCQKMPCTNTVYPRQILVISIIQMPNVRTEHITIGLVDTY